MSETALHNLKKDLTQSSVANIIIICEKTILFQLFCKKKESVKRHNELLVFQYNNQEKNR